MAGSWSGTANIISMSPGGATAVGSGAFTIAVLVKPSGTGTTVGGFKSNVVQRALIEEPQLFGVSDFSSGFGSLTSGSWYVALISKPAGSAHYRFGLWPYASNGSGSMTLGESTGSANHGDGSALDEIRLGDGVVNVAQCDISVVGLWTSQLTDPQAATLVSTHLSAWAALSPAALLTLNGWNGSTGVVDVVGSSTFTSLTGTVASSADAPSFDFSLTPQVAAALTGAGTLTAAATVKVPGTAALAGAGTLAASATVTVHGAAALAGAGVLTAAATVTVHASAALTGAGSLAASATVTVPGAATLAGAGTLTAAAAVTGQATATMTGAGSLSATATVIYPATVSLTAAGTLTATGTVTGSVSAALTAAGTLTATATVTVHATATLTGAGVLTAKQTPVVTATVTLTGAGTLTAVQQPRTHPDFTAGPPTVRWMTPREVVTGWAVIPPTTAWIAGRPTP